MVTVPFALYDAFSEAPFGGSQAGVVGDASRLDADARRRVAREIGAPATGFATAPRGGAVEAQFFSAVAELPMCGHGTMGLMTWLVEEGALHWNGADRIDVDLNLPGTTAAVEISRREDGRPLVMLDVAPPSFRRDPRDTARLGRLLALGPDDFARDRPIEIASGDFVHLLVPVRDLAAIRRIDPDFGGLTRLCREAGIATVAVFCTEVERPDHSLHLRDFCPAVGVPESAAAGTTNAALTGYLVRHGIVRDSGEGRVVVLAEQGHEIGRPSSVRSIASMKGTGIARLQVGGFATKVLDGRLHLPRGAD